MAKKPLRRKTKPKATAREKRQKQKPQEEKKGLSDPWLSKSTGYRTIGILSLLMAAFMIWQLWPSEGPFRSIMWGLGSGVALWGIFFLSLGFNTWVRRRRD